MKNLKKWLSLSLAIISLVCILAGCGGDKAAAHVEGSAGLEYQLSEDGEYYIYMGMGTCTDTSVVIGNWHEGKPVQEIITKSASVDGAKTITVSEGITTLNHGSLSGNNTVEKYVMPNGIESYATTAFIFCPELKEIVIGTGLKEILKDCFGSDENLTTVYFRGTEEEWNAIEIDPTGNEYLLNATIVYNYKD